MAETIPVRLPSPCLEEEEEGTPIPTSDMLPHLAQPRLGDTPRWLDSDDDDDALLRLVPNLREDRPEGPKPPPGERVDRSTPPPTLLQDITPLSTLYQRMNVRDPNGEYEEMNAGNARNILPRETFLSAVTEATNNDPTVNDAAPNLPPGSDVIDVPNLHDTVPTPTTPPPTEPRGPRATCKEMLDGCGCQLRVGRGQACARETTPRGGETFAANGMKKLRLHLLLTTVLNITKDGLKGREGETVENVLSEDNSEQLLEMGRLRQSKKKNRNVGEEEGQPPQAATGVGDAPDEDEVDHRQDDDMEVTLLEEVVDWTRLGLDKQTCPVKRFRPCTNTMRKKKLITILKENQEVNDSNIGQGLNFLMAKLLPVLEQDVALQDKVNREVIADLYHKTQVGECSSFEKCAMYKKFRNKLYVEKLLDQGGCGHGRDNFAHGNKIITLMVPAGKCLVGQMLQDLVVDEEVDQLGLSQFESRLHGCCLNECGLITSYI